jgi:hypothetical protein
VVVEVVKQADLAKEEGLQDEKLVKLYAEEDELRSNLGQDPAVFFLDGIF